MSGAGDGDGEGEDGRGDKVEVGVPGMDKVGGIPTIGRMPGCMNCCCCCC
jgi:hypothetical protein